MNKAAYTVQTFFGTYFPNICFLNQDFCALVRKVSGLRSTYFTRHVRLQKNQSEFQNTAFLLVDIFFHIHTICI